MVLFDPFMRDPASLRTVPVSSAHIRPNVKGSKRHRLLQLFNRLSHLKCLSGRTQRLVELKTNRKPQKLVHLDCEKPVSFKRGTFSKREMCEEVGLRRMVCVR